MLRVEMCELEYEDGIIVYLSTYHITSTDDTKMATVAGRILCIAPDNVKRKIYLRYKLDKGMKSKNF